MQWWFPGWMVAATILTAQAEEPELPAPGLVAPGPQEFEAALVELERRVGAAEAVGRALSRVQSAWTTTLEQVARVPCSAAEGALIVRSTPLGVAERAWLQSARAEREVVAQLAVEPTITPVVDDALQARVEGLLTRVSVQERRWVEQQAWQAQSVQPWLERCKPALIAAPGLTEDIPRPKSERRMDVAVLSFGSGRVCPDDVAAGGVVILKGGLGCYGDERCDCSPAPQLPAAVLGPPPVTEP